MLSLFLGNYIFQYICFDSFYNHVSGTSCRLLNNILFIRLDIAVFNMLRFYIKYPENLAILYNKRTMWTNTVKIIQEASTNPQVQAISVAVKGALAWKCLDV